MFYDARLVWLEKSIEECIALIPEYLKRVSPSDTAGRGRLLNAHGCALDELGRYTEALPVFEKAAQTEPSEMAYFANIAETHEKLENMEQALVYAKKAIAGGNVSEVTQRIVERAAEQAE